MLDGPRETYFILTERTVKMDMACFLRYGCILVLVTIAVNSWILRRSCLDYAIFSYIRKDAVLQGAIIKALRNKSPAECESECVKEHFCRSVNTENGGDRTCELNIETEADTTANLTLTPKTGWTFKSTNYSDPWVGKNCKDLKPCPLDHVCMDSCTCPGYECYKCRGINIGLNCLTEMILTGRPLGLQDNRIEDYQITSSSHGNGDEGFKARLKLSPRWCANKQDEQQYIRVDFAKRKIITDIAVQGHPASDARVTSYQLDYSEDRNVWKNYKEEGVVKIFDGSIASSHVVVKQNLQFYIRALAIKLRPKTWNHRICMRMEIYGVEDYQPMETTDCASNEVALGMESGTMHSHRITASSQLRNANRASYARLNHHSVWMSKKNDANPYLQVDLGKKVIVTAVAVQGRGNTLDFIKRYRVTYSDSTSISFTPFIKIFQGNTNGNGIVKNRLDPAIQAQIIRIIPIEAEGYKWCLRMELYGCDL